MPIYLDHISATPLHPHALEAMLPYLREEFGNPSSLSGPAMAARKAIEAARERVAALLSASPKEIVFTATATEANNLALRGCAEAQRKRGKHIITSSVEHVSVLGPLARLEKEGFEVTRLPVDSTGRVDPRAVLSALTPETILVSIQHANPEVGAIQPLDEIGDILQNRDVVFHADAAVTAGLMPISVDGLRIDLLTFSAQSVYGPKGVGALYVRRGTRLRPILDGGSQEGGRRPGTENVAAIVGLGAAAEIAMVELSKRTAHLSRLGKMLLDGLNRRISGFVQTGPSDNRLPGHASGCIERAEGEALTVLLEGEGIIATTATACSSGNLGPSPVLRAMGMDSSLARNALILSAGRGTSEGDVRFVLDRLPALVARLRKSSPVGAN